MATGNIRGGKRNYAKVSTPTTVTATASTTALEATVSFTPSTLGPAAASYIITGSSTDGGATVTLTSTSTSTSIAGLTSTKSYTFSVAGNNYNGASAALTSDAITAPNAFITQYLVVGGGGGGGSYAGGNGGGGGGAGGYRTSEDSSDITFLTGTAYTVTVGAGGAIDTAGSNSVLHTITATGGGRGAQPAVQGPTTGGSGGGGAYQASGGNGGAGNTPATTPVQGFRGGNTTNQGGAGGGGASAQGVDHASNDGSAGGAGRTFAITSTAYAGGGGGGGRAGSSAGAGGTGGGGSNSAGTANRGGGGGGGHNGGSAGVGGSGVVIIRIPDTYSATFSGGVTQTSTTPSGYVLYTVTAAGISDTVTFSAV